MKICNKCGKSKRSISFCRHKKTADGLNRICRQCAAASAKAWAVTRPTYSAENSKKFRDSNKGYAKRYAKKYNTTIKARYRNLKSAAKRRGWGLYISIKEYSKIIKSMICYYCDDPLHNSCGYSLNRIDSKKGYKVDNVKPCCGTCNRIMNSYTREQLKSRLIKIYRRL